MRVADRTLQSVSEFAPTAAAAAPTLAATSFAHAAPATSTSGYFRPCEWDPWSVELDQVEGEDQRIASTNDWWRAGLAIAQLARDI